MGDIKNEVLHKEIDLIQACIARMAHNSFLIKGWAVTIVAVVLALAKEELSLALIGLIVLIPLASFWYLDAFFLYTEKLYRKLYEWVIKERAEGNSENLYDLNTDPFVTKLKVRITDNKTGQRVDSDKQETIWTVMISKTLRCFYGIPIAIIVVLILLSVAPSMIDCFKNAFPTDCANEVVDQPNQTPAFVNPQNTNSFFLKAQSVNNKPSVPNKETP